MAIVYGVAGMRERNGRVTFWPRLGKRVEGLKFSLAIQGRLLDVDIEGPQGRATYELREGADLVIGHLDELLELKAEQPVIRRFPQSDPLETA